MIEIVCGLAGLLLRLSALAPADMAGCLTMFCDMLIPKVNLFGAVCAASAPGMAASAQIRRVEMSA
jgi:hypothetical protein